MENGHTGDGRGFARPKVTHRREPKPPFLPKLESRAGFTPPPEKVTIQVSPVWAKPKQEGPARQGQSVQDGVHCASRASGQAFHSSCGEAENGGNTYSTTLLLLVKNVHSQWLSTFCSKHVRAVDFGRKEQWAWRVGLKGIRSREAGTDHLDLEPSTVSLGPCPYRKGREGRSVCPGANGRVRMNDSDLLCFWESGT